MAELLVLDELRDFLISEGAAQDFYNSTPSDTTPGLAREPKDGAPLPREGEGATITLRQSGNVMLHPLDAWMETTAVEMLVRARFAPTGRLIQRGLRSLFVPRGHIGGRIHWMMGALLVQSSAQWRQESSIAVPQALEQRDLITYDTVQAFRFTCLRSDMNPS